MKKLLDQYAEQAGCYEQFAERCAELIARLLEQEGIEAQISSRGKELPSLERKLLLKENQLNITQLNLL